MTAFLVVGIVGTAIIVLSLLFGDLLEGAFGSIDVDAGAGALSAPVIGSFLSAAGFGGALVMAATNGGALIGALGGGAVGLVIAGLALHRAGEGRRAPGRPYGPPARHGDRQAVGRRALPRGATGGSPQAGGDPRLGGPAGSTARP